MKIEAYDDLYEKLSKGPAFLLLGQNYLSLENGTDPFLSEILRKYGQGPSVAIGYSQILDNKAAEGHETALAWMQERCTRFSIPLWLETVASFAWSGVYSSAVDVIWSRSFRSDWRELQPILSETLDPADPRNRSNLHCTFLFGSVDQQDLEHRAPITRKEMTKRRQVAISLLRRLPRQVTPFGVLLIEGYSPQNDWLPLDDLLAVIDQMGPGQVHLFHADSALSNHPDVADLVNSNKLTLYEESLAAFLKFGEVVLQLGLPPSSEIHGHKIEIADHILSIPLALWNQVSRSAIIVDDVALLAPQDISREREYSEFRNFLARSGERPIWSGYFRGFAFTRDFETRLNTVVENSLGLKAQDDETIILYGRSGIGKTVALGALAVKVRMNKKHPVLFIERRAWRPNYVDIDAFLEWAKHNGILKTLIIWDGMLEAEQYSDLLNYLNSRGHNVTLVGSTYSQNMDEMPEERRVTKLDGKQRQARVSVPSELSEGELKRFANYLKRLAPNIGDVGELVHRYGASFFVALYRILPPTQHQLNTAIILEVVHWEDRIRNIAEDMVNDLSGPILSSPLAYALAKAGYISEQPIFSNEPIEIGGELLDQIEHLIGLVMVPGQFGIHIPIDLLVASLKTSVPVNIADILGKVDLFDWSTDAIGNIFVGPRHPLEAEIIVKRRLGGPQFEIAFVVELLRSISANDIEMQFVIDLVRKVNPPEKDPAYNIYGQYLLEIADCLTFLRNERNIVNPRLMLQETNLLREITKLSSNSDFVDSQLLLDKAEDAVNQALRILENDPNPNLRSQLLVELAATHGARAKQYYQNDPESAVKLYWLLTEYLSQARATNRGNFYPVDVLFWTTQDLIRAETVNPFVKLNAQAEILSVFEMAQLDETFSDQERFLTRRLELGQLVKNQQLTDEAYQELERQGSTAGYYLKATQIAGKLPYDRELNQSETSRAISAASFLEQHRQKIKHDGRCLQLLFKCWWLSKTKKPLFLEERQTLPFSRNDWQYCFEELGDILRCGEVYQIPLIKYLFGITQFHLGTIKSASMTFGELERDPNIKGRRRILKSYLASLPDGSPRKFSGTVSWIDTRDNRGEVFVPDIHENIPFLSTDFRRPDIRKGIALNGFHIAFNFRGFLADPASRLEFAERRGKS